MAGAGARARGETGIAARSKGAVMAMIGFGDPAMLSARPRASQGWGYF